MRIAICASEVVPFAKTGGLADVAGALPLSLEDQGQEVIVVMPRYKTIQGDKFGIRKVKEDVSCAKIGRNIQAYFIESEKYYNRDSLYMDKSGDYPDNLDRFSYFCRRTLQLLKEIKFKADIIHVHDWQASLIPVYLKSLCAKDQFYKDTKTVLTIHNIGYQGLFPKEEFPKLGLDWSFFDMERLEFFGKVNLLKGGIVFSDMVNTVSPTYAKEIQTKEFGFGLEGILAKRKGSLFGILNGIDYAIWDPQADTFLAEQFSIQELKGKNKDKADLQRLCNLPVSSDKPLFGIVSRLADQKGFDLLAEAIDTICRLNLQVVILGTGDPKYHTLLTDIVKKYPKVMSLHLKFDDALAHKIYAGSDFFLMPSQYEPCGLGQLISLRYGTVPIVFKTGGLADTINKNNGFVFSQYKPEELVKAIKAALAVFKDKAQMDTLVNNAMKCNFSWETAAKAYIRLYEKAVAK